MTTVEEKIQQAWKQLGNTTRASENFKQGFVTGYTEANKWISVEEELPPFEDVPINERTKYLVKICTGSISPKIDVRIGCLSNHRKWIGEMDWVTVTHWRPIN